MKRIKLFAAFSLLALSSLTSHAIGQPSLEIFADEFTGPRGAPVDFTKWTAELGGGGWGNEELQYYSEKVDNVRLDGSGNLEIRALPSSSELTCWYGKCRFTSGRLITKGKFDFKYGTAEARIKVPSGAGVWPAFWMLGSDIDAVGWPACGEIDIMEFIGKEPSTVYGTIHGVGYSGAGGISRSTSLPGKANVSDDFHRYSVKWSESEIRWFLDGKLYSKISRKDIPKGSAWVFDKPHFLLVNFAVGGKWPGSPSSSTIFPQSMLVDYIRVTSLDSAKNLK
jgi:beta-glucanase (GH16 family)